MAEKLGPLYALRQAMGLDMNDANIAVHSVNEALDEDKEALDAYKLDDAPCALLGIIADLAEWKGGYETILQLKDKNGVVKEWKVNTEGYLEELPDDTES